MKLKNKITKLFDKKITKENVIEIDEEKIEKENIIKNVDEEVVENMEDPDLKEKEDETIDEIENEQVKPKKKFKYRITSPNNFPPIEQIEHGEFIELNKLPEWSKNNIKIVIEKLDTE